MMARNESSSDREYRGRSFRGGFGSQLYGEEEVGGSRGMRSYNRGQRQGWNRPGPHSGKGPRGYQRSEERICEDVCERLAQHGMLDASEIQVEVHQDQVILKGTVIDRQSKRLAEDIAESAAGVRDVHNELHVKSPQNLGQGRVDRVGQSGVYPALAGYAPQDAEVRTMASRGQGERGAEG